MSIAFSHQFDLNLIFILLSITPVSLVKEKNNTLKLLVTRLADIDPLHMY